MNYPAFAPAARSSNHAQSGASAASQPTYAVAAVPVDNWRDGVIELSGLDGSNGFVINGVYAHDVSGYSVASAGDVNGDGIDDLIIGAFDADPAGRFSAGQSYVVFGSASGFDATLDLSTLDGSNGFIINGIDATDQSGTSVASAGDVNGDGISDLIIGAVSGDPGGRSNAGESYVVFGSASGFAATLDLSTLDGSNGFVINGIDVGDLSASPVSSAGDVNGDGIGDLIIGAMLADPRGLAGAGETYVVFGSASGFAAALDLSALDGSNGFVINGIDANDRSGSVAGAGDVNGDGIDDLIIGAHLADPGGRAEAGESYVVFGTTAGFAAGLDLSTLDGSNGFVINGIDANDYSGRSVAGAGDVNGDGIDDLIIGAYLADPGGRAEAGESYVVFGTTTGFAAGLDLSTLDGSNGFVINGIDANDFSGRSVAGAGDVNGDGIDDLIIGAFDADPGGRVTAGESYVVFGSARGFTATLDLSTLDGSNGFVINGIDALDQSGFSVASAGDVNSDGYDDLIVGATNADPGGRTNAGETYIIYGHASGQTEGTSGNDRLVGATGVDTLNGYEGNDYLFGGYYGDTLVGGSGDDFYDGVTFPDTVVELLNEGNDTIRTRINNYTLGDNVENLLLFGTTAITGNGNALDNHIVGTHGGNILNGFDGNDFIEGLAGEDTLYGGNGDDRIEGGRYGDTLSGESGNDTLDGGKGFDTLHGGDDDDTLLGGGGADILFGDAGNDLISGGIGRDEVSGGAGADTFAFADGDLAGTGPNSSDRITDFSQADGDLIDLSALDAIAGTPENDSFTFIGEAAFTGTAGELRFIQREAEGWTMVKCDTDGDGVGDVSIRVDGLVDFTAADFGLGEPAAMAASEFALKLVPPEALMMQDFAF